MLVCTIIKFIIVIQFAVNNWLLYSHITPHLEHEAVGENNKETSIKTAISFQYCKYHIPNTIIKSVVTSCHYLLLIYSVYRWLYLYYTLFYFF